MCSLVCCVHSTVHHSPTTSSQNTFKINEPPNPETGYDGMKAFEAIMDGTYNPQHSRISQNTYKTTHVGMWNFMRARIFGDAVTSFGYIGGGTSHTQD